MRKENEMWDLSTFGYRELDMAGNLLKAICKNGYPDDFDDNGVRIEFNPSSGDVFLTNDNGDVCMDDSEGNLYSIYWLSYHGNEGCIEDLIQQYDDGDVKSEDYEQLADLCERNGFEDKANEIREKIKEEES